MSKNGKMIVETVRPPANATRGKLDSLAGPSTGKRPAELSDSVSQIRCASSPDGSDPALRRVAIILAALVVMCLVMSAVVWWRLLA